MSEDKNYATIGQRIFSEIDSDQYLNKLYSYLLFNYALKLFSPESIKPKEINYIDALRFADLLSITPVHSSADIFMKFLITSAYAQDKAALKAQKEAEKAAKATFKKFTGA